MSDALLYASALHLNRTDMTALRIKDAYSIHKLVYGLFEDTRTDADKLASVFSGIVYADKGGDFNRRQILILSNRKPHQTPQFGTVLTKIVPPELLLHDRYAFEITINPTKRDNATRKILAIHGKSAIEAWFKERAISWGFNVHPANLQIEQVNVQFFEKAGQMITHCSATIRGELIVEDRQRFNRSFMQGIGRGRAFGFGLLQIVPL